MAHDGGHDGLARRYFDRAFRLATAANEQALAGNACASMAHLAVELDQADDALHIAAVGLDHARKAEGTARLIARLYSMQARAFALSGDRHACTQALDCAKCTLASANTEAAAEWIARFDDASLASEAALCFLRLAELEDAEHQAREVIRLRSGDRVRSRAFGQLTLAKVLVKAGRIEEAAALGHDVCRLATTLSSVRVIHRLQELGNSLAASRRMPEVSTFLAALGSLSRVTHEQEGQGVTWPV